MEKIEKAQRVNMGKKHEARAESVWMTSDIKNPRALIFYRRSRSGNLCEQVPIADLPADARARIPPIAGHYSH